MSLFRPVLVGHPVRIRIDAFGPLHRCGWCRFWKDGPLAIEGNADHGAPGGGFLKDGSPFAPAAQELADAGFESRVQEVDLGDMDYAEDAAGAGVWRLDCRCGEAFVLREDDLSNGIDVLQCLSCSLWIRPLYCAQPEPDG